MEKKGMHEDKRQNTLPILSRTVNTFAKKQNTFPGEQRTKHTQLRRFRRRRIKTLGGEILTATKTKITFGNKRWVYPGEEMQQINPSIFRRSNQQPKEKFRKKQQLSPIQPYIKPRRKSAGHIRITVRGKDSPSNPHSSEKLTPETLLPSSRIPNTGHLHAPC